MDHGNAEVEYASTYQVQYQGEQRLLQKLHSIRPTLCRLARVSRDYVLLIMVERKTRFTNLIAR